MTEESNISIIKQSIDVTRLRSRRGHIKASLTRFTKFLSDQANHHNQFQITARLEKIEILFAEYDEVQSQLEDVDILEANERETIENAFFTNIATARSLISNVNISSNNNPQLNHSCTGNNNIKLPTIELPTFTGDYEQYVNFHETFSSLIHTNKSLTDIQRFHYLRSSLKDEAAQIIAALEISAANYTVAWDLIKQRYENKKLIIHNHVKALFELTPINKESNVSLRQLLDNLNKHIRALKVLGQPIDQWDTIIIYLVNTKLDFFTKKEWETSITNNQAPTLADFTQFLNTRCSLLETLDINKKSFATTNNPRTKNVNVHKKADHTFVVTHGGLSCYYCKNAHTIYNCQSFLNLPLKAKYDELRKLKLCTNCLRSGHSKQECKGSSCKKCKAMHNTVLHVDHSNNQYSRSEQSNRPHNRNDSNNEDDSNTSNRRNTNIFNDSQPSSTHNNRAQPSNENNTNSSITAHSIVDQCTQVLLSTALVYIYDKFGKAYECRALLDSGSQSCLMSRSLHEQLQLPSNPIKHELGGIGQSIITISQSTTASIKSRQNDFTVDLQFLIIDRITDNVPSIPFNINQLCIPRDIILSDPFVNKPREIDILLGASIFYKLHSIGQIDLGRGKPTLQNTKLGWVLSGMLEINPLPMRRTICNMNLDKQLTRFWNIEEIPTKQHLSDEEKYCEEYFTETTTQDDTGRFIVKLPCKDTINQLGDSKHIALQRFNSIEARFARNPELKTNYVNFMDEYKALGHMSECDHGTTDNSISVYLPHHPVIKGSSVTTKTRVVFDASAKTESGTSLNDHLFLGPTIQDDIFSIMLRFRVHPYVLTADIIKMYRQILIHPEQRNLQTIVWRSDASEPMKTFTLNTVTYGTKSAPHLAIRCLQELAHQHTTTFPFTANVILKNFYVDDLLCGVDSIDEGRQLQTELIAILRSGGFELSKWSSNDQQLLETIDDNKTNTRLQFTADTQSKTLGVLWDSVPDELQYSVRADSTSRITKRHVLSIISQVFDPLGLVGPMTIRAKILMQRLWQEKTHWDETLSPELYTQWLSFSQQLQALNTLSIPRYVSCNEPKTIQLHAFCDSSMTAYGCCFYIRSTDNTSNHSIRLLCAKSKVAPLKTITLPRLELCGAHLLAKLYQKITRALDINIDAYYCWTDSTIVMAWLNTEPCNLKIFVANRVASITELTDVSRWRHVKSEDNPADVISRGINPEALPNMDIWWNGPRFLLQDESQWPRQSIVNSNETIPDRRDQSRTFISTDLDFPIFDNFSRILRLQRTIAYCFRFANNARKIEPKLSGPLTVPELNNAMIYLIKRAQAQEFRNEIELLKASKLQKNSNLISLNPFLDKNGVLRVGGRLVNSNLTTDNKHPIILSAKYCICVNVMEKIRCFITCCRWNGGKKEKHRQESLGSVS